MKNKIFIVLVASLLTGLFSCIDLEEKPVGLLAPEGFFKSKKEVQAAVYAFNGTLAHEALFGRQYLIALLFRDDMCDLAVANADRGFVNSFDGVNSNNSIMRLMWNQFYVAIAAANTAEAGAKSLGLPEADINPLIAECSFNRAFCYFHLVRSFGDLPYINQPIADPATVAAILKTPSSVVYDNIIADLKFAKQWLPEKQPSDCRSRPTKGTAASYLASVYLTKNDFANAYAEAKYVIDNKALFGYVLEADYQNLFKAITTVNTNKETVYSIDFQAITVGTAANGGGSYNDDLMAAMTLPSDYNAGFGSLVPSLAVYQSFNPLDYRKTVSFDTILAAKPYTVWNTKRPHIAKFNRFPGNAPAASAFRYSDNNYQDMRYAEVLLIAAEASCEINNGPNADALGYVNQIRARARNANSTPRAYPADVALGLSKSDFINLILEERRIEFGFEWKRWFDIKRRDLGDLVFKGSNSTEPHPKFDKTRDYLFPIPQTTIDVNTNITQNPGY
ncbi:MAG: RagB/SusD family nutrient uptake outer membrane protein [Mariniphaga sp.]|nr:RagB/SusD family nutrient uptake outer membrane protein [Mariniphaga sp.]